MHLDYAAPQPRRLDPRIFATPSLLAACAFLYLLGCVPAIQQRGYPPIDAHWQGATVLWIAAVPLSALFQRWGKPRLFVLLAYALLTAYIDAASWPTMVPNFFDPLMTLIDTIIIFGPLHVLVTALLEGLSRLSAWIARAALGDWIARPPIRITAAAALFLAATTLPAAYAAVDAWRLDRRGRTLADKGWSTHKAFIFVRPGSETISVGDIDVKQYVDPATGLRTNDDFALPFASAYNRRIAERLRTEGKPPWAEPPVPPPADLAAMLHAPGFQEISTFPYNVNANIILTHGGTVAKWGTVSTSPGPGLTVDTASGLSCGAGNTKRPTFLHRDPLYPSIIFIRDGNSWIGAFDDSGNLLEDADVNP
jgi:hypothetical protein